MVATAISPELSNPAAWDNIFKTLGFSGGLVVLFVVVTLVVVVLLGYLTYRVSSWVFGPDGWMKTAAEKTYTRLDTYLGKSETVLDNLTDRLTKHSDKCETNHQPRGPGNVHDLRLAGHAAADAIRIIGGGKCDLEAARMHAALDGSDITAIDFNGEHFAKPNGAQK